MGQGALGIETRLRRIETRSEDEQVAELVSALNHQTTWCAVLAERAFLRALGGGCRAAIAALGILHGDILRLDGMVASPDSRAMVRCSEEGSPSSPEEVGIRLAHKMLNLGASKLITEAKAQ